MTKYKVPVIRDYEDGCAQYELLRVKPNPQEPYSQCTREGSDEYPAPHKYRDISEEVRE